MNHTRRPAFSFPRVLLCSGLLAGLPWAQVCLADGADQPTVAVGIGMQHLPRWTGARASRYQPIPYVDIEIPHRLSLSTQDGLQLDLVGGSVLHAGLYGDYQWGRDSDDLGVLRGKIAPLSPRLTLGGYLEWQLDKQIDVGANLSHDIQGAGAYFKVYTEWDLPPLWLLQHSLQLNWQAMNGAAMNRFFGVSPAQAGALQIQPWQPGAGSQLASLEYDLFVPTSKHTGFALAVVYGQLLGDAGDSPLVARFGSRGQWSESLAFVYHD
ncbi:structural protein MipA [Rhodanobacter sp. B05]|jgi:outer membrane scaffolding protein for murein synthesis (MipA/OmpV family)|uniref:MipA/OmpV family protein n=1 Tax=Rhodanobacter sp. B05 TaxID=1945859 RepID=UPI000984A10E|nr:MipA/OmpV family protein [Rhodanobacter sp. B05]OOG54994.1 structural protein MipA [Rhodanobacter sp. B05]